MFCTKCGAQAPDDAAFCNVCGNPLTQAAPQNVQPAAPQQPQASTPQYPQPAPPQQPQTNAPQYGYSQPAAPSAVQTQLPMRWHKFLIYFALWAGGVLSVFTGITTVTGKTYEMAGVSAETVYNYYPGMKGCDLFFGVAMLAAGALLIYTRFQLAGYKAKAPRLLALCYGVNAALSLLYTVAAGAITGLDMMSPSVISSILVAVVMIFVNLAYYKKRAALFCN